MANQVNIIISAVINQFQQRMSQVQQTLDQTAARMEQLGSRMQGVGAGMTQAISVPLAGLGAAAVASAAAFDESQGRIQARLGATAAEAEKLNKVAQNVWKQGFGENIQEAADGITTLKASMGDISDKELQAAAEAAFTLQKAFDVDVTESAKTASTMMKQFGISATEAYDVMAATMQATGDVTQDALDTLWEYSPAFAEAGLSAKDAANMIVNGMEAGAISTDKLGDAVNEWMTKTTEESKASRAAMEELGFNAQEAEAAISGGGEKAKGTFMAMTAALANVKDEQKQNMLGIALYGSMWEDTGKQAILAMTSGKDALGDVSGAAAEAGKNIQDNIGTRLSKVWRGLQVALLPVGQVLISMLESVLPYIESVAKKFETWFNSMSKAEQKAWVMGAAIVAAIGPALVVFGTVVKVLAGVIAAFSKFMGAIKVVWGWLSKLKTLFNIIRIAIMAVSGPVWATIAAIAALIAIGVAVYKNWEQVSAFLSTVWEGIKNVAVTVFSAIGNAIVTGVTAAYHAVVTFFTAIGTAIATAVSAAYNAVKSAFLFIVNVVTTAVTSAYNAVKSAFAFIVTTIAAGVMLAYNTARAGFTRMMQIIQNIVTTIRNLIKAGFQFIVEFISSTVSSAASKVSSGFNTIKNLISSATNAAKNAAVKAFNGLKDGIMWAINNTIGKVMEFANDIVEQFTGIDLLDVGRNIIQGLANGISGAWGVVKKAAKGVADKLLGGFQEWLGINSPSIIADREIGRMWGAGLARGLVKSIRPVANAAQRLANSVMKEPGSLNLRPSMSVASLYGEAGNRLTGNTPTQQRTPGNGEYGRVYQLDVPLSVDGREIARATARFTDEELQRMETNRQRAAGVIIR